MEYMAITSQGESGESKLGLWFEFFLKRVRIMNTQMFECVCLGLQRYLLRSQY